MSENKNVSRGLVTLDVLFFIFLVLKLTGQITWSWWLVTAPLWIPLCILALLAGFIVIASIFE